MVWVHQAKVAGDDSVPVGIGVVAGFTTTGEFSALLNDGVYLTIASSVLTDDQLYEIIPSVVSKL
jgi:hypothetical protein